MNTGIIRKDKKIRLMALALSVLMLLAMCACGKSSTDSEVVNYQELPEFGDCTGLTKFLSDYDVALITYCPGTEGDRRELSVSDAGQINEILNALKKVSISGITQSFVTDWYPYITLEAKSGEELYLSFDGEWLSTGKDNYILSGMDEVWKLIKLYAKEPDPLTCGDFVYEFSDDGSVEITQYTGDGGTVIIPEEIEGLPVTSIGYKAFYECDEITELVLPSTLNRIGRNAFAYCDGLSSLKINCTDLLIDKCAFEYCDILREVIINGENIIIGREAFHYCGALNKVEIKGIEVSIGSDAFEYCRALKGATVSGTVSAEIADDAFSYCGSEDFSIAA